MVTFSWVAAKLVHKHFSGEKERAEMPPYAPDILTIVLCGCYDIKPHRLKKLVAFPIHRILESGLQPGVFHQAITLHMPVNDLRSMLPC